jgi:hypothetical protein
MRPFVNVAVAADGGAMVRPLCEAVATAAKAALTGAETHC